MMIITLSTNVEPLKPSEGFPERQFQTNYITTTTYEFNIGNTKKVFTEYKTNSIVGTYLPMVITNLVPAHYEGPTAVPNR